MGVKYLFIFKLIIIILKYLINNNTYFIIMNYENKINEFNKYHYIIVIGKKAAILGSSNDLKEALEITDDYIQKNKKFENKVVARLELEVISERLLKRNDESKIKTIGGPIQIKIEFYKILDDSLKKLIDYHKNNTIFLTKKFLNEKKFDEKILKIIASAAFNNLLKNDLFVLNIIDDIIKN